MLNFWRLIVSLNDPQLTADFQNLCGIKSVFKYEQNCCLRNSNVSYSTVNKDEHSSVCEQRFSGTLNDINLDVPDFNGCIPCNNESVDHSCASATNGNCSSRYKALNGDVKSHRNLKEHTDQYEHDCKSEMSNGYAYAESTYRNECVGSCEASNRNYTYNIDNVLLYYIFSFGASLGNEVFYVAYFSCGLWAIDCFIFRKVSLIWCAAMYLGQAAKDLICWSRPSCPPAVHLERRYEMEYGMPSTHAMVGVVIPFGFIYFAYGYYEYNFFVGIIVATAWSVLVSASRLYLGMHSVLDILVGNIWAIIIFFCCMPFVDLVDCVLIAHPWCFPGLNILILSLCFAYPRLRVWSTARGDTTQVLAVFSGTYQGLWYMGQVTTPEAALAAAASAYTGWAGLAVGFGRYVMGVVFAIAMLAGLKKMVIRVMCRCLGLDPHDPVSKQHFWVELPYKYIGYFVPSFCSAYSMPILFQYLGWHRQNYLFEILHHSHHFGL